MMRCGTLYFVSQSESSKPVGPAPTIRTGGWVDVDCCCEAIGVDIVGCLMTSVDKFMGRQPYMFPSNASERAMLAPTSCCLVAG